MLILSITPAKNIDDAHDFVMAKTLHLLGFFLLQLLLMQSFLQVIFPQAKRGFFAPSTTIILLHNGFVDDVKLYSILAFVLTLSLMKSPLLGSL